MGTEPGGQGSLTLDDAWNLFVAVGVLIAVVAGAIYGLWAGWTYATERWNAWEEAKALDSCKANLTADLKEIRDPKTDTTVTKCTGKPKNATCFVQSLEDGIYKTRPFVGDCSRRYTETNSKRGDFEKRLAQHAAFNRAYSEGR